jgi:glycosidase
MYEFHVARAARDRYQFDEAIFQYNGNAIFANFHAARTFAQKMNQRRDLTRFPEQAVRAGQISAMGLIDEISHWIFRNYRQQTDPAMLRHALAWLDERVGGEQVAATLRRFSEEFPPVVVYRREQTLDGYLVGETGGQTNRETALEELLMLWLANVNPAFGPFMELFSDDALERDTAYQPVMRELRAFFGTQPSPAGGAAAQNIIDLLRAPALAHPHSLDAQLAFMLERWSVILGSSFPYRLLIGMDVIREEERPVFGVGGGDATAATIPIEDFRFLEAEPEQFTPDREWMPNLVLLAKNAFVWLDQLAKQYQKPVATLADVPDEELDRLASAGFTGLWLIGLWERSNASQRIKQMMGNPEAVASAYSLYDYQIAHDLGGDSAMNDLRERAWKRGIRMASDMVPNHVGIDGRWVIQHPDWFVSLPEPPFPAYTFNGPDLSEDERVGIFLEDHYYDKSDAAVVFKRVDRWTGSTQFIYHGNDGTAFPWNDTAQLNYLSAEVREAVIQTILHVARNFPIIRFDAAMTLAKRHFHRLWYPEPGSGGDIPSRAEHGMTREQLDQLMPQEFWREVVDRCAVEAPDTLLLAEAFWLMEGYFVRTLGMHRVYNSAFMVMLRDEDNAKYRLTIKNTIEFDPEILRRYVNFMNNPDERTAVDQFGKDEKYFGVATLLVTMPGLPMFGHGQVEGFTEKYGMEYRRAYWDETPDGHLMYRHERELFPLMHKRYLFTGVESFLLYDFYTTDGEVCEDVFAFSNRAGDERALVVYHNRSASVRGWIHTSAAFAVKTGVDDEKVLAQRSLAEGVGLHAGSDSYAIFRDEVSGLEYIRHSRELAERGMYIELGPYERHVFLGWREVQDVDGRYGGIAAYLAGRGVPSVEEALRETFLQPVLTPFRRLMSAETVRGLAERRDAGRGMRDEGDAGELAELDALDVSGAADAEELAEAEALDAAEHLDPTEALADELDPDAAADETEDDELTELASPPSSLLPHPSSSPRAEAETLLEVLLAEVANFSGGTGSTADVAQATLARLDELLALRNGVDADETRGLIGRVRSDLPTFGAALGWVFTHALGSVADPRDGAGQSRTWLDEWLLGRSIARVLRELGANEADADRFVSAVKVAVAEQAWHAETPLDGGRLVSRLLADDEARRFMGVNRYQGVLWFNKERFDELLDWLQLAATLQQAENLAACERLGAKLAVAASEAGYQVDKLLTLTRRR